MFLLSTLICVVSSQIQTIDRAHVAILRVKSNSSYEETICMIGVWNNCSTVLFQDSTKVFLIALAFYHGFLMFSRDKDQRSALLPLIWSCRLSFYMKFLVTCWNSTIFIVFKYDTAVWALTTVLYLSNMRIYSTQFYLNCSYEL